MIYTPNSLNAKSKAIQRVEPVEGLYATIRKLATNGDTPEALVTLAKYHKEEDIQLILKSINNPSPDNTNIYYIYGAINNFPHPDFLPFLEKNLMETLDKDRYSNSWGLLYKAIAKYQNEKAVKLLEIPFSQVQHENIKKYHIEYVLEALRDYKVSIYDELLWRLWSEETQITADIFDYLFAKNPQRAYLLVKKNLENTNTYYVLNISFNEYDGVNTPENLLATMLGLVLKEDKAFAFEIICKNIKEAGVHIYPVFTNKVIDIQDISFVTPLFERLRREDNAHIYLKIVDALISYKDNKVNQQILALLKVNPALTKDWGGEELEKKLKENKIK